MKAMIERQDAVDEQHKAEEHMQTAGHWTQNPQQNGVVDHESR